MIVFIIIIIIISPSLERQLLEDSNGFCFVHPWLPALSTVPGI